MGKRVAVGTAAWVYGVALGVAVAVTVGVLGMVVADWTGEGDVTGVEGVTTGTLDHILVAVATPPQADLALIAIS